MELRLDLKYPEGATPLDPSEMQGLLLPQITTQAELNLWEQRNILEATMWLERSRSSKILTKEYLLALHRRMFGTVWDWAGTCRKTEKNIGVSWIYILVQLKALLDDVGYWIEHSSFVNDEIGARFHHRLVSIHIFSNGNGRHARLATDALLMKILKAPKFSWGAATLEGASARVRYIKALRKADNGNIEELLAFVRS